jgi:Lrp/AsnC family transcriptional regulator for asnA, asnC and gidA
VTGCPLAALDGNGFHGDPLAWPASRRQDDPVPTGTRPLLDEVSKQIIEQLQEDGRRAYATIGKAVGLSEAAVRQRVQRLVDSGVIQIVAVTDPLQVGFTRQAMIGVRSDGDLEAVAEALGQIPEVDYLVITAGSFDILVEVVCEDDEHLLDLLTHRIRTTPGVRTTETFVYLKLHQQHYDWGTR